MIRRAAALTLAAAAAVALLALMHGCRAAAPTRIGAVLPLTGDAATYGVAVRRGLTHADAGRRGGPAAGPPREEGDSGRGGAR
ncbi:MAG: hypothetical protein AAF772_20785, partial [Acidobacteriota bacterium]